MQKNHVLKSKFVQLYNNNHDDFKQIGYGWKGKIILFTSKVNLIQKSEHITRLCDKTRTLHNIQCIQTFLFSSSNFAYVNQSSPLSVHQFRKFTCTTVGISIFELTKISLKPFAMGVSCVRLPKIYHPCIPITIMVLKYGDLESQIVLNYFTEIFLKAMALSIVLYGMWGGCQIFLQPSREAFWGRIQKVYMHHSRYQHI